MSSDSPTASLPDLPEKIANQGISQRVRVTGPPPDRPTEGIVRIRHWDESERTTRAMKRLALSWLLALVAVAIPYLRFCLVPGLFVAGPVAAWLAYRMKSAVLGGVGWCPHCGRALNVARHSDEWPLQACCNACGSWASVEKNSEPEGDCPPS